MSRSRSWSLSFVQPSLPNAGLKVSFDLSQRARRYVAGVHRDGRDAFATTDGEMRTNLPDLDASSLTGDFSKVPVRSLLQSSKPRQLPSSGTSAALAVSLRLDCQFRCAAQCCAAQVVYQRKRMGFVSGSQESFQWRRKARASGNARLVSVAAFVVARG